MPQLALVLTTVIWAATFPATKRGLEQGLPLSFLFQRFLVSSLVLALVFVVARRPIRWTAETLRTAAITSVFLFVGYVAQTVGMRYTTASNSAFITALYVVLVPLFLRRFDLRLWTALSFAVSGLWLLIRPSAEMNRGDLYTLVCAVAFALHIIAVEPALAAWLSWLVLGERLDAMGLVGSGLIMAGVLIGTMPARRADASFTA